MSRALALGLVALTTACGVDQFEEVIEDSATIPGSINAAAPFQLSYGGGSFTNLDLSKARSFTNQGVSPGDVDSITVKSVRLQGAKDIDRVAFFEYVEFYIEAPGQERRLIAQGRDFPMDATGADLDVTPNLNLKPYATAASMQVSATAKVRQQPLFNTTFKTTMTLLVDINLAGI